MGMTTVVPIIIMLSPTTNTFGPLCNSHHDSIPLTPNVIDERALSI